MHCASIPTRLWGQGALPCRTKKADFGWDQVDLVPGALLALFDRVGDVCRWFWVKWLDEDQSNWAQRGLQYDTWV